MLVVSFLFVLNKIKSLRGFSGFWAWQFWSFWDYVLVVSGEFDHFDTYFLLYICLIQSFFFFLRGSFFSCNLLLVLLVPDIIKSLWGFSGFWVWQCWTFLDHAVVVFWWIWIWSLWQLFLHLSYLNRSICCYLPVLLSWEDHSLVTTYCW